MGRVVACQKLRPQRDTLKLDRSCVPHEFNTLVLIQLQFFRVGRFKGIVMLHSSSPRCELKQSWEAGVVYSVESGSSVPLFPLLDRLANGTESQRHRRPSWVVKDLTHAQQPSNRQRDPLWPSPASTGQAFRRDFNPSRGA
jgi:hypothetical protein